MTAKGGPRREPIYALSYDMGTQNFGCDIAQAEIDREWSPWEIVGAVVLEDGVTELVIEEFATFHLLNTEHGLRSARDLMLKDDGGAYVYNFWAGAAKRDIVELLDVPTQPR